MSHRLSLQFYLLAVIALFRLLSGFSELFGQATNVTCSQSIVFCGDGTKIFESVTNSGTAEPGPCYDCLSGGLNNPGWYFMQVDQAGRLEIRILPKDSVDIDFVCWGPFDSPTGACVAGLTCDKVVSCSWSGNKAETCVIENGEPGKFYLLVLTNFNNLTTDINLWQRNWGQQGAGSTNCNITIECSILALSPIPTTCDIATNTYSVSGTIEFTNPPQSGDLTIKDATAVPPVIITIPANPGPPYFTSPLPFTIPGIPCDGLDHTIEAVFSEAANPCSFTDTYSAPASLCPNAIISGGGIICNNGQQSTVYINFSGAPPPYTFTYTISGTPYTETTSDPVFVIANAVPGLYLLTQVSGTCQGTVNGSATVTLVELPAAPVPVNPVFYNCGPGIVTLTAIDQPGIQINWYDAVTGGTKLFTGNPFVTPGLASSTTFYAEAETLSGSCISTARTPFTAEIRPIPTMNNAITAEALCSGASPGIILESLPTGATYTWTAINPDGNVSGYTNPGSGTLTAEVLSINSGIFSPGIVTYSVTPTLASCPGSSSDFQITVNPFPDLLISAASTTTICSGGTTTIELSSHVTGTSYSWTASGYPGTILPAPPVSGNSNPIEQPFTSTSNIIEQVTFSITPIAAGCISAATPYTISVNPVPAVLLPNPAEQIICSHGNLIPINLNTNVQGTSVDYSWSAVCEAGILICPPAGNAIPPAVIPSSVIDNTLLSRQNVIYSIVARIGACSGPAAAYTVKVNPVPDVVIPAIPANPQIICSGEVTQEVPLTSHVIGLPVDFTWTVLCDVGIINCPSGNSGMAIPQTVFSNGSNLPAYAMYTVSPAVEGCIGVPSTYQVQVNPSPTVLNDPLSQNICSGSASALVELTASVEGTTFSWIATPSSPDITGYYALPGSGNIPVQTIYNSSAVQGYVNYHIIPSSQSGMPCPGAPADYKIFVNPLPEVPIITGGTGPGAGHTECENQPNVVYQVPLIPGHSYQWTISGETSYTGQGTNSVTVNWGPAGIGTLQVTVTDQTLVPNCSTNSQLYNVTLINRPVPTISVFNPPAFTCQGAIVKYVTEPLMLDYTWGIPAGAALIGGGNSTSNFVTVKWNNPGLQTITVNYKNDIGCYGLDPGAILTVEVHPLPDVSITGPPSPFCQDFPVLYPFQVPPQPESVFQWTISPLSSGTITPGSASSDVLLQFSGTGTTSISVSGINSYTGCSATSIPVNVFIQPKPEVSIISCFDQNITQNAKSFLLKGGQPLGSSGFYTIDQPTGSPVTSFNPATVLPGLHKIYYSYTDVNGCIASDFKTINVLPSNSNFPCFSLFTDPRDGNVYHTVPIGAQCWMQENLRYGGTTLPYSAPQTDNCLFERNCLTGDPNCTINGGFYQWDELMQYDPANKAQGFCPPGWHIPNEAEWNDLITAVSGGSGDGIAGAYLKELQPITSFKADPAGIFYLNSLESFTALDAKAAFYWTSSWDPLLKKAVARGLHTKTPSVSRYESSRANAFPVRCVKD